MGLHMGKTDTTRFDLEAKVALMDGARGLEGLDAEALTELAGIASVVSYAKGELIFRPDESSRYFHIVAKGLVKISILAPSGLRLTYLLAKPGEPLNLVGPITGAIRSIEGAALKDTLLLCVRKTDFNRYTLKYPVIFKNVIRILGKTVDSANLRIIDMVEKRVEQRLVRVLNTLYVKFGPVLAFNSTELAELTGTTTESTLRALGRLRQKGIVSSGRGQIQIEKPDDLTLETHQQLWL
jgi:CRP-like cAMP-binding protein